MNVSSATILGLCLCAFPWAVGCSASPKPQTPSEVTESAQGAGAPGPTKPTASNAGQCADLGLVDDFEDGDNRGVVTPITGGYWYTYSDPSSKVNPEGTFMATASGAGDSAYCGRMTGEVGAQQYPYVGMGVSFTHPKRAFDASCCAGVSFWGKKSGDGIANVRLKVGDWQTDPEGGACKECYNDFGADLTFTDEWQKFTVRFAEMRQEPYWGEPKASVDPTALYQLQWQVKENNRSFDIAVDDVHLIGCGGASPEH